MAESQVEWETHDTIHVGTIRSEKSLHDNHIQAFHGEVKRVIEAHPKVNILLNFERVPYLSSTALARLVEISGAMAANGGHLRLCGLSEMNQEIFRITNFDKTFIIRPDGPDVDLPRFQKQLEVEAEEQEWNSPA